MLKLPTIYVVVTNFAEVGIGSAGDACTDRDDAYDQFAECVEQGQPARAFVLEFDVETNAFEVAREITDELQAELEAICADRGISIAAE
ncbi:MAG: hypothetical protein CML69_15460 [Rhodobacteraceae bacterium]|nr:hypothetical protein [Paracoccaceae bacterium]|tara:strand:+ start:232 stop:498 length:267 start_codon:yes stop_codon:yes gene_type:complete